MKSCRERQADLKAYLDGELPMLERLAVGWHLLRCAKCREARMAMLDISRRLSDEEPRELDPALRARILSSVSYSDRAEPTPAKSDYRRPGYPILLLAGATAAGLLVVVMMAGPRGPYSQVTFQKSTVAAPSAASSQPSTLKTAAPVMAGSHAGPSRMAPESDASAPPAGSIQSQHAPADSDYAGETAGSAYGGGAAAAKEERKFSPSFAKPAAAPAVPPGLQESASQAADARPRDEEMHKKQMLNGGPPVSEPTIADQARAKTAVQSTFGGSVARQRNQKKAAAKQKSKRANAAQSEQTTPASPAAAKPIK